MRAAEHLTAELARLDLMLRRQVLRLRAANLLVEDELRGLYVPDSLVDAVLTPPGPAPACELTAKIEAMRAEHAALAAAELPLPRLAHTFQLSCVEQDALLIGLAPEVDRRYETLYAYVQNDVTRRRPTVDLALQLAGETPASRLDALAAFWPDAPLRRHQIVSVLDGGDGQEPPLPSRVLVVDPHVVELVLGRTEIDARLRPFAVELPPVRLADVLVPDELRCRLAAATALLDRRGILFFEGPPGSARKRAAAAMCAAHGARLLAADLRSAIRADQPVERALGMLRREAALRGCLLYLDHFEEVAAEPRRARQLALSALDGDTPVFVGSHVPWRPDDLCGDAFFAEFRFPVAPFPLRLRAWREALAGSPAPVPPEDELTALANQFALTPGQIRAAAGAAASELDLGKCDLRAAARAQSGHGLRGLAQKVETVHGWDDLVLPGPAKGQLREVCASITLRHVVYSAWGFQRRLALGTGLAVLFSGPSGTGKTMAASVVAREVGLDLYRVDLSTVVSKYIGETERNLSRIFEAAEASNAILFFDEADALFGKRSEVRDAHDRYANIEVAYLLQRIEQYEGLVILATNLSNNLDEAFARRMHHTVEFPAPDAGSREAIWRGVFPPEAPLAEDVDLAFMARQFELVGGGIRNIALAAAFLAAEEGAVIGMGHVVRATARELQKRGQLPSRGAFRQFFELVQGDGR